MTHQTLASLQDSTSPLGLFSLMPAATSTRASFSTSKAPGHVCPADHPSLKATRLPCSDQALRNNTEHGMNLGCWDGKGVLSPACDQSS